MKWASWKRNNDAVLKRMRVSLIVSCFAVWPTVTLAEGPLRLVPPPVDQAEEGIDLVDEETRQAQERARAKLQKELGRGDALSGISVQKLNNDALGAIGVYAQDEGGLGAGIWRGVAGEQALDMLGDIPVHYRNQALANLAYRLMSSLAYAPEMMDPTRSSEEFDLVRMAWLLRYDRPSDVQVMYLQLAQNNPDTAAMTPWAQSYLESGEITPLCSAPARQTRIGEKLWQRIDILCLFDQGRADEASFALDLYREFADLDDVFIPVMDHLLRSDRSEKRAVSLGGGSEYAPLRYLWKTGRVGKDMEAQSRVYSLSDFPVEPALQAEAYAQMESKMLRGEIRTAELKKAYLAAVLGDGDIATILDGVMEPSGADGRALYYSVMEQHLEFVPEGFARDLSRLELLQKLILDAKRTGDMDILSRLFAPEIASLPVSGAMLAPAMDFVPLLWLGGYLQKAEGWISRLGLEALASQDVRTHLLTHWPILMLTEQIGLVDQTMVNAEIYYRYLLEEEGLQAPSADASGAVFQGPLPQRLILVASLLNAFDKLPDHPAYQAALDRAEKEYQVTSSANPVVQLLARDMVQDRRGPVLARSLTLLGEASGRDAQPALLMRIVKGLVQSDADRAALAIAIDRLITG